MFCSRCGARIPTGQAHCRQCGTPAEYAEYCGGFWGLVDQSAGGRAAVPPTEGVSPSGTVSSSQASAIQDLKRRVRNYRRLARILLVISLLLLCISVVLGLIWIRSYRLYRSWAEQYAEEEIQSDEAYAPEEADPQEQPQPPSRQMPPPYEEGTDNAAPEPPEPDGTPPDGADTGYSDTGAYRTSSSDASKASDSAADGTSESSDNTADYTDSSQQDDSPGSSVESDSSAQNQPAHKTADDTGMDDENAIVPDDDGALEP